MTTKIGQFMEIISGLLFSCLVAFLLLQQQVVLIVHGEKNAVSNGTATLENRLVTLNDSTRDTLKKRNIVDGSGSDRGKCTSLFKFKPSILIFNLALTGSLLVNRLAFFIFSFSIIKIIKNYAAYYRE